MDNMIGPFFTENLYGHGFVTYMSFFVVSWVRTAFLSHRFIGYIRSNYPDMEVKNKGKFPTYAKKMISKT